MDIMTDLAVVIPIYISNEKDIILETLKNVRGQIDCKIYVPWNGSDDNERNIIEQISLFAIPIYVKESKTKAENLNAFLNFISPEIKFIIILDADSRLEKRVFLFYITISKKLHLE